MKKDTTMSREKVVKESILERQTESIFDAYDDFLQSDRKTSGLAIEVGNRLFSAQISAKKEKVLWKDYCKETLSDIELHEIRDCLVLARRFKKNPLPCLLMIKRTNLIKFFRFCKGKSPKIILSQNEINLITENASKKEIRTFQVQILRLLQSANKKKTAANKQIYGKAVQQPSGEADPKSNTIGEYGKRLLKLIKQDLEKPKDQLKPFPPQKYNNYLALQKALGRYIKARAPRNDED